MSLLSTEKWESGKVHLADSGDMVRSKQERFVANLLASEGISFEYERKLSSWDGSFRYPDFTLFINGELYYWEHWGMVDDYSYRQDIAKRIRWYREHGYYDYLIQTWGWGWGDRDLRGQVLAELYKLRKPKRRKREYKPVSDSHVDWKTGHERLTEKLEQTVRDKMSRSRAAKKPRNRKTPQSPRGQQPETAYRPEEEDSVGFISQDSGQNIRGWVIPLAIILTLFLLALLSLVPYRCLHLLLSQKCTESCFAETENWKKRLQTIKKPHLTAQKAQTEKSTTEKTEVFYMGIKISR